MTYTKRWFAAQVGTSETSASVVAPLVADIVKPRSMVDVGCGLGGWAAAFAKHGVPDVMGVDGDYIDRSMLRIPADRFRPHDLTLPLDLGRSFDLAISLEVAEHLPERAADRFVETLTRLAPVVLFSAAVPGQGGNNHVNEQWQSYWIRKFADMGYDSADVIRAAVWSDERVEWWYRQNTLLYFSKSILDKRPEFRALTDPARRLPADLVHPRMLDQFHEAAKHPMKSMVRGQVVRLKQTAKRIKPS